MNGYCRGSLEDIQGCFTNVIYSCPWWLIKHGSYFKTNAAFISDQIYSCIHNYSCLVETYLKIHNTDLDKWVATGLRGILTVFSCSSLLHPNFNLNMFFLSYSHKNWDILLIKNTLHTFPCFFITGIAAWKFRQCQLKKNLDLGQVCIPLKLGSQASYYTVLDLNSTTLDLNKPWTFYSNSVFEKQINM